MILRARKLDSSPSPRRCLCFCRGVGGVGETQSESGAFLASVTERSEGKKNCLPFLLVFNELYWVSSTSIHVFPYIFICKISKESCCFLAAFVHNFLVGYCLLLVVLKDRLLKLYIVNVPVSSKLQAVICVVDIEVSVQVSVRLGWNSGYKLMKGDIHDWSRFIT